MVSHNGAGRSVQIGVHVEVILLQVALDQELILLGVPSADHQIVLTRHKPVELLEPVRLAQLLHRRHRLHLGFQMPVGQAGYYILTMSYQDYFCLITTEKHRPVVLPLIRQGKQLMLGACLSEI